MNMDGKTAVVAGGTGRVGEGIVKVLLTRGAHVFVPVRSEEKQKRLEDYVGADAASRLTCVPADVGDEASVEQLRKTVTDRVDHLDLAVASLGGWYYGYSLHHMPTRDWHAVIDGNLTTHFLFMRAFLSVFHDQNDGTYVMINGGAADVPAPDSGVISVVAAAQKMMGCVLAEEAHGTNVRVYTVEAFNPVRTRRRGSEDSDDWVSAEQLGEYILRLYAGAVAAKGDVVHTIYSTADV